MITLLLMQCSDALWLRLLSTFETFGGVLQEKNCTRTSFSTTVKKYISEESSINEVYNKIQLK